MVVAGRSNTVVVGMFLDLVVVDHLAAVDHCLEGAVDTVQVDMEDTAGYLHMAVGTVYSRGRTADVVVEVVTFSSARARSAHLL